MFFYHFGWRGNCACLLKVLSGEKFHRHIQDHSQFQDSLLISLCLDGGNVVNAID
jgi:hypothetical protein